MHYFLAHWRGRLSLSVTLWVNVLILIVAISYIEIYMLSRLEVTPTQLIHLSLVSLFLTRLIVFSWQIIGLFRAIEADFLIYRNNLRTRGLQGFALFLVMGNMVYSIELVQSAVHNKRQIEATSRALEKEEFNIRISEDQKGLHLNGVIKVGVTAAMRRILERHSEITAVTLQSLGGQIYEGRGLAKLFIEYELDTFVFDECTSACATAFIGGRHRYLGTEGRLGFHQYSLDVNSNLQHLVTFYDPTAEQERDLELYLLRGVSKQFRDKMYAYNANQMWYPEYQELLEMRVIDGRPLPGSVTSLRH